MPLTPDVLHLLLARAGDRAPTLPDGLPIGPALATQPFEPARPAADDPAAGDVPEDMSGPVWGVIAPEGAEGDRLLALAAPLIAARQAQQGRPAPIYRVPRAAERFTLADAIAWRRERYDSGADLGQGRADYQLILGDLDAVPLAIQELQSLDAGVGRLAFDDDAGYEAYVEKILRAEGGARRGPGRIVMATADDGSRALEIGISGLSRPGEALLHAEVASSSLPAREILAGIERGRAGMDLLLKRAAVAQPGVLFTLSHGVGAPYEGWRSPADQRATQGAMAFGVEAQLTGADVAARTFMPGGLWLMFACFSAGTPSTSAYAPWLERMAAARGKPPPSMTRTLAVGAPFIADIPRRALANPNGPLAFVGHIDLAWTYSFRDGDGPEGARSGRFMRVLAGAMRGAAVGDAFRELSMFVTEADRALTGAYADEAAGAADPAAHERRRALLWMARQDLAGFILLGDPLAKLPVGPALAASIADEEPAIRITDRAPIDRLERAIAALILGQGTPAEIAAQHGVEPSAFEEIAASYRQAGRQALVPKG